MRGKGPAIFLLKKIFDPIVQDAESYFPDQESNLPPLQWKLRVLTTEPPGKPKSPDFF